MKKFLVILIAISIVGSISAYSLNMKNMSDGVVNIEISYGGAGVCSPDRIDLQKGQSKNLGTGICCPKKITIKSLSGSAKGKQIEYSPRRTGFGISCRNNSFTVHNPVQGELGTK